MQKCFYSKRKLQSRLLLLLLLNLTKIIIIQATKTQPSTYGLGLFLCEPCEKGDLIIGMTFSRCSVLSFKSSFKNTSVKGFFGQQISHEGKPYKFLDYKYFWNISLLVAMHRGRQYTYELNPSMSVDATFAGNEARFINHSSTPNCFALSETFSQLNLSS